MLAEWPKPAIPALAAVQAAAIWRKQVSLAIPTGRRGRWHFRRGCICRRRSPTAVTGRYRPDFIAPVTFDRRDGLLGTRQRVWRRFSPLEQFLQRPAGYMRGQQGAGIFILHPQSPMGKTGAVIRPVGPHKRRQDRKPGVVGCRSRTRSPFRRRLFRPLGLLFISLKGGH
jgi:hypothetical protein